MKITNFETVRMYIEKSFKGLSPLSTWGEFTFFYNPECLLTRGTYFCTLKEKNGDNDQGSALDREGVFRLNFGLPSTAYVELFGAKPGRPPKGCIVQGPWDFTELDTLMPHPVYGWMGWVAVLNPSSETLNACKPLLELAYTKATNAYEARIAKLKGPSGT